MPIDPSFNVPSFNDPSSNELPLSAHLDANFLALHYLKLKIHHMIKSTTEPERSAVTALKIFSNHLPEAKADLDRNIAQLEKRNGKLRQSRAQ